MYLCKLNVRKALTASLPFSFAFANILVILQLASSARFKSVYPSENMKIQSEFEDSKELTLVGKSQCSKGIKYIPFSISLSSG